MPFNYAAFKAQWRALAQERGIDAQEGATAFQAVAAQTEERKRTHFERQQQAVRQNAQTHTPEDTYQIHEYAPIKNRPNRFSATPRVRTCYYGHWDNGQGAVDFMRVKEACGVLWWAHSELWGGGGRRITIRKPVVEDQENIVSRFPPPDALAFWRIKQEARMCEGLTERERTRIEDKRAIWREAWAEDGAARKRQKAALIVPARSEALQLAFA